MSGDLEDFLRRAAERRQAKAAGQPMQGQPVPHARPHVAPGQPFQANPIPVSPTDSQRSRPQYTDSRTERVVVVDEPILVAEVVEDHDSLWQERRRQIEKSRKAAEEAESIAAKAMAKAGVGGHGSSRSQTSAIGLTGNVAEDLLRLLQSPIGIQQAVLLREILDRPVDRWE